MPASRPRLVAKLATRICVFRFFGCGVCASNKLSWLGLCCLCVHKLLGEFYDLSVGEVVSRCVVADPSHLSRPCRIGSDVRSGALPSVCVCGSQGVFLLSKFNCKSRVKKPSVLTFSALRLDVVSAHPKTKASRTPRN